MDTLSRTLVAIILAVVASGCIDATAARGPARTGAPASGATPVAQPRPGIDRNVRDWLAWARAQGRRRLTVVVVTRSPGAAATDSVVHALAELGGVVRVRFDDIGYVRAILPTAAVARIGTIPGVADFGAGGRHLGDSRYVIRSNTIPRIQVWNAPAGSPPTCRDGARGGCSAAGAVARPLLDAGALARNDGYLPRDEIRADLFAAAHPLADGRGVTIAIVEGRGAIDFRHEALQVAYTLDGDTIPKVAGVVDPSRHMPAIGGSRTSGARSPARLRPRPSDTIVRRAPQIHQAASDHTTMAAATAAGNGFLGGPTGGIAPGARLLLVPGRPGIEPLILAARDPRTDVISSQVSDRYFPDAAGSVITRVLDRVATVHGKPIFISAGNSGPRLGTVTGRAAAPGVMAVGASISQRSFALNESQHVPEQDNIAAYSSRGPTADGALEPDVVAPTQMVTAGSCAVARVDHPGQTYSLPPCYRVGDGTSNAAPFVAGAAALLISAARHEGFEPSVYDGPALAWALAASARRFESAGVHEQGAGLIRVDSAWQLLKAAVPRPRIRSSGPVENAYAPYLTEPGRGPGIYLREGVRAGRRVVRSVTLHRTSGPAHDMRYRLRLRGNDGTFAVADSIVVLERDVPVELPVAVMARTPGVHSAAIEVLDAETDLVVHRVPLTVIAALALTEANGYMVEHTDSVAWPRHKSIFIEVPNGTGLLRIELGAVPHRAIVDIQDPLGARSQARPAPHSIVTVEAPTPGTWELTFRPSEQRPAPIAAGRVSAYTVEAAAIMAEVEVATASEGDVAVTFTNRGAVVPAASLRGTLGRRRVIEGTIPPASADTLLPLDAIVVAVEPGTASLHVALSIDGPADAISHRADLHVYHCAAGRDCYERTPMFTEIARQEVLLSDPAAGTWKVVIDPVRVRRQPIRYTLGVTVTHPKWGVMLPARAQDIPSRPLARAEQRRIPLRITSGGDAAKASAMDGDSWDRVGVVELLAHETPGHLLPRHRADEPAIFARAVIALRSEAPKAAAVRRTPSPRAAETAEAAADQLEREG